MLALLCFTLFLLFCIGSPGTKALNSRAPQVNFLLHKMYSGVGGLKDINLYTKK